MKTVQFSIDIQAPKEKVWSTLWDDATYRQWTSVFFPGSYAESGWKEGGPIRFIGPDGSGMYSTIEKKDEPSCMAFRHIGEVKEFKELPVDGAAQAWTGSMETYRLEETDGGTRLLVEMDVVPESEAYFNEKFPGAMAEVKRIAEG